jgi:hypothetical protein
VRTPLGPALPHLAREPLERIGQTRDLLAAGGETLGAAVLRPAPWLLLTRAATHDGARFREREVRLGAARLGVEELALIERCDGRTVAELEAEPETLKELIEAGLLVA